MTRKKRELTEDGALEIAVKDHPQWRRAWQRGELPEEIPGEDGEPMSPLAHLHIHAIVERQLAADDPKGVAAIARELEQLGASRHDVRHEIRAVISQQIWHMTKNRETFNADRYFAAFRDVVESYR